MDLTAQEAEPAGTLATERLVLRPLAEGDAAALAGLLDGDWEAVKQTGRMPYPATERALRRWIGLHMAPASHSFLILRRRDRVALGGIGFGGSGALAELGYVLGRPFWGQGYATEGVRAMMAHAAAVGFGGLEAYSFLDNPASARVLAKAGFADHGVVRRDYPERGGLRRVRRFERRMAPPPGWAIRGRRPPDQP
jgi:RimJ/RimL family protein N-acetyltransferase